MDCTSKAVSNFSLSVCLSVIARRYRVQVDEPKPEETTGNVCDEPEEIV
jgi:hypothetical protein